MKLMSTKNLVGASEEVVNERDSLRFHPWFRRFNIWLGNAYLGGKFWDFGG